MFEGLSNLASMFKQARQLGSKLQAMSDDLKNRKVEAAAGGGLVTVEVNGLQQVLSVQIDPSLLRPEDREMVEDLVLAAVNQGLNKAKELHAETLRSISGGMNLPGMEEVLGKLSGQEDVQDGADDSSHRTKT